MKPPMSVFALAGMIMPDETAGVANALFTAPDLVIPSIFCFDSVPWPR